MEIKTISGSTGSCRDAGGAATCNNFVDFAELFDSSEPVESGDIVVISFEQTPSSLSNAKTTPQNLNSTHNPFQNSSLSKFQNSSPEQFQKPSPINSKTSHPEFQNPSPAAPKSSQNPNNAFNTENNSAVIQEETSTFKVKKSTKPYDKKAIGIVSTQPAIVIEGGRIVAMGGWKGQNNTLKPAIALAGRVPVKATAENGPIQKGDLLTTSSKPGYAMKCEVKNLEDGWSYNEAYPVMQENEKCRNSIIGKALESLESGEGKILMFVSTQ